MVYKYIDIVGTSPKGIDDSVRNAVEEGSKNSKEFAMGRIRARNSQN